MDQYFRDALEGIKQTAEALQHAIEGIKKTADAMLTARDDHEDLRVTVTRVERELLQLSKEFREYRNRQP